MYKKFYRFTEEPFTLSPDPKFLYLTRSHKEALHSIMSGIQERKGIMVITGEVGVGKTLLIRTVLKDLSAKIKTAFIFQPRLESKDLLKNILLDLEVPLSGEEENIASLMLQFRNYLNERLAQDETVVIIIDEAQTMAENVLEDLFRLSSLEIPAIHMLQILLVGQPELEVKLNSIKLERFKKNINIRCQIRALNKNESEQYIQYHLNLVNSDSAKVFTPEAISLICKYANRNPRSINLICDNVFWIGFQRSRRKIDLRIVKESLDRMFVQSHDFSPFRVIFSFWGIPNLTIDSLNRINLYAKRFLSPRKKFLSKEALNPAIEFLDKFYMKKSRLLLFIEKLSFRGIPDSVKEALSRTDMQVKRAFSLRGKFLLQGISDSVKETWDKIYMRIHRIPLKEFSLRKISDSIANPLNGIFVQKQRLSALKGKVSFGGIPGRKIIYSVLSMIFLSVGIFLIQDHMIKISSEKMELMPLSKNTILAGKTEPLVRERETEVTPQNSMTPNLEKTKPNSIDKDRIVTKKVSASSPKKKNKVSTRHPQTHFSKEVRPLQKQPSVTEKVIVPERKKETEVRGRNISASSLEETNSNPFPDQLTSTGKEEPKNLGVRNMTPREPVIIHSFASKKIKPGDIWKVYLKAINANGNMKSIFAIVEKGGSQLSIIEIKKENREILSGYIYLNTLGTVTPNINNLTLSVSIKDTSGHFSEPAVFPLSLQTNIIPEEPPQGIFEEQELGPIMIQMRNLPGINRL